ncbi:MAG: TonB-dependent receptor [Acidobacteria bacterium]|nr:TonB-dependent receptor [Acidobacteriota bacterium]
MKSRIILFLTALLTASLAFAQTSPTAGALIGVVTDGTGAALPGVTVTVSGPQLQGTRVTVSDEKGEYNFPLLPAGTYNAQYELNGVKPQVRENIIISAQRTTKVDVPVRLDLSETVTVTASQVVVDPTQTTTQQTFKEDHLKYATIGSANRSYQNVLFQAPGVAAAAGGGSNPAVSGANYAQNVYTVDGLNTTDPVTHTFGPNLSFSAIQEISVQTLGKDAEYGKASGGTINVITKSGGNQLSGSLDVRYNDPDFLSAGHDKTPVASSIPFYGATPGQTALRFNKSAQTNKSLQPEVTLGGPIVRDKLWFFGSSSHPETTQQPANRFGFQPGQRKFTGWDSLGKLTYTPLTNQTFTLRYLDSHASITNSEFSSFVQPEADSLQTQHVKSLSLNYDAIYNAHLLANVQIGHTPGSLETTPQSGDFRTPGIYDLGTGISSGNYTNHQARKSNRDELIAATSYYLEAMGTHAFKVGVNLDRSSFSSFNNTVGDPTLVPGFDPSFCSSQFGFPNGVQCAATLNTLDGDPFQLSLSVVNGARTVDSKGRSFFIQDQWNPISRLTLRLGLRHDNVTWSQPGTTPIPDFNLLQPRIGAAYDILNNGNSIVHGFYGRIMDDNQLTLPNFGVAIPIGSAIFEFNPQTNRYVYDPASSGVFLTGGLYDPNLKPSFSDQASLGFTQRVFRNTSIDVTGQYRKQKNLFEDYCANSEEFLPSCIITNNPGFDEGVTNALRSDYRGITAKVESRPTSNSSFVVSYTRAKSRGSTESTQNQNTNFDVYPAHFENTYGYLSDDARDRVNASGYYKLPWDVTVGGNWYWDSGTAYSVTQTAANAVTGVFLPYGTHFVEPRGSRRLPHFHQLDLQVQKDFQIGQFKAGLIASVLNALNTELPTGINGNAGSRAIADANGHLVIDPNQQSGANRLSASFGQYTSFQRPRRYEVGVRFEF